MNLLRTVDHLEKIFIVSQVELKDESDRTKEAVNLEELAGIWVDVAAASGEKCERCWIIEPSVGDHDGHTNLCDRCAQVVIELETAD